MKSSCIRHSASYPRLVILREDYLRLCHDDHCKAVILNTFEHWHNVKSEHRKQAETTNAMLISEGQAATQDMELWVWKSQAELAQDDLLGLYGERKVRDSLAALVEDGYLSSRRNPIKKWDATVQYKLEIEFVQAAIDALDLTAKMPSANGKNAAPSGKKAPANGKIAGAIPEITTEITITALEGSSKHLNAFALFEKMLPGGLTALVADDIKDTIDEYGADWVEAAIREGALGGGKSWNYVLSILKSCRQENRFPGSGKEKPAPAADPLAGEQSAADAEAAALARKILDTPAMNGSVKAAMPPFARKEV